MQFGPYVLGGTLGSGGTATVYRAQDTRSGQRVALKLMHPEACASPRFRRRFTTEVQTLTRLRHPNAIRVYEAGDYQGQLWVALDLVEGESLQARLSREATLPVEETLRILKPVADALAHAHDHGVLHRDVKPDNVLLAGDAVVLTDFGLALDQEQAGELSRLSREGVFLGTPGFWAPEQAKGRLDAIGPATDVYGLGATLYACLTGEPPVQGKHLVAFLRSGAFETVVPLRERRPDVPQWLDEVCARCLASETQARYPDGRALLDALQREDRGPARSRWASLAAGLGGLGLFAAAALALSLRAGDADLDAPAGPRIPPLARVHGELTRALNRARLHDAALATGSVALSHAPEWPAAWAERAFAHARLLQLEPARADAARALELDPDLAFAHAARAEAAIATHDGDAAVPDRDRALQLDPQLPWAHIVDGGVLRLQERFAESEAAYRRAIALDPELAQAYSELGFLFSRMSRMEEALAVYRRCAELTPYFAEDWRNVGRSLVSLGREEEGLAALTRSLELEPGNAIGLHNRARLLFRLNRFSEARRDVKEILEANPKDTLTLILAGQLAFRGGFHRESLAYFDRALALEPDKPELHFSRSATLRAAGRPREARASLDRALELAPYDPNGYALRAQVSMQLGAFESALEDAERGLGLDPDCMAAVVARAMASGKLGDYPQAVADMQRFLDSDVEPNAPERPMFRRLLHEWREKLR